MPYTFTSWTACTDPAGNARTLDWSEAGMTGQPPGLYLEALRQAAAQRKAVEGNSTPTRTLPPEWSPSHGIVALDAMLEYVDAVAWSLSSSTSAGWVARSAVVDIEGDSDLTGAWPAPITTEASLLTAAGHTTRIARPTSFVGVFPGAYLRQLRDVFIAKTVYQTYHDQASRSGVFSSRSATGASWSAAAASYDASTWATDPFSTTGAPWCTAVSNLGGASIERRARFVQWHVSGPDGCAHTTVYLYAKNYSSVVYGNLDYPHLLEDTWGLHVDDQAVAYNGGEDLCRIDAAGAEPTGQTGYYIKGMLSVCDYRDDFTLGI